MTYDIDGSIFAFHIEYCAIFDLRSDSVIIMMFKSISIM